MQPQLAASQVLAYITRNMGGPPDGLGCPLRPNFGTDAPPGGNVDPNEIIWRAENLDSRLAMAQGLREAGSIVTTDEAGANWFDHEMGPGRDLLQQIIAEAKKA